MTVVDSAHAYKRKGIAQPAESTAPRLIVIILLLYGAVLRFGSVKPPAVHAYLHHIILYIAPVDIAGPTVKRVVDPGTEILRKSHMSHKLALGLQLLENGSGRSERRPYRYHGMSIKSVHLVHHAFRIGEERIEKLHGIPVVVILAPVLPVLHDAVERHSQTAVTLNHIHELILTAVALARLAETETP